LYSCGGLVEIIILSIRASGEGNSFIGSELGMKRRSPNVSVSIYSNFQVRTDVLNRGKMQGKK
jgi:hypothetical protein